MKHRLRPIFLCLLGLSVIGSTGALGQQPAVRADNQLAVVAPLAQGELDALLAPIALYPDQLLAQVLMAATYPLQVVTAARFVQQNPSLTGAALDQALRNENWDPSVISLTAYPQVLLMMNDRLDWTQQLGEAFLANQQQVMDTVQTLRSRAQAAGNLQNTPQQTVMDQGGFIDIEPAQPQYVYVPVYDPRVIYGAWPDPIYQPVYWYPPPIYGYPDLSVGIVAGIFFGLPCAISSNHWGWAHPNWRGRDIDIDGRNNYFTHRPQYAGRGADGRWTRIPDRRNDVAFHDRGRPDRLMPPGTAGTQVHEPDRGRDLVPQQVGTRSVPPTQPTMTRNVAQPPARALPLPPQRVLPGLQPQPTTQATPQASQAAARPGPQLQPFPRALPQPQPTRAQSGSPSQPFTRVMQLRQQSVSPPAPPQQLFARATAPRPQTRILPAPQSQAFPRAVPAVHQVSARPAPVRSPPAARPMPQRSAAQASYRPPPRAQAPMGANRGSPGHQANNAPHRSVTSRS
jgi:hypothetical protein